MQAPQRRFVTARRRFFSARGGSTCRLGPACLRPVADAPQPAIAATGPAPAGLPPGGVAGSVGAVPAARAAGPARPWWVACSGCGPCVGRFGRVGEGLQLWSCARAPRRHGGRPVGAPGERRTADLPPVPGLRLRSLRAVRPVAGRSGRRPAAATGGRCGDAPCVRADRWGGAARRRTWTTRRRNQPVASVPGLTSPPPRPSGALSSVAEGLPPAVTFTAAVAPTGANPTASPCPDPEAPFPAAAVRRAHAAARRFLGCSHLADDVVQDAMLTQWQRGDVLEHPAAWLLRAR